VSRSGAVHDVIVLLTNNAAQVTNGMWRNERVLVSKLVSDYNNDTRFSMILLSDGTDVDDGTKFPSMGRLSNIAKTSVAMTEMTRPSTLGVVDGTSERSDEDYPIRRKQHSIGCFDETSPARSFLLNLVDLQKRLSVSMSVSCLG
jgi:hypothetical protein